MALLDEAGFTSVVATNCDQHYVRPLVPGDHLEVTSVIDSVSTEKKTGLGVGPLHHHPARVPDQDGELVATMLFRILKFKPAHRQSARPSHGNGHRAGPPTGRSGPDPR